RAEAEMYRAHAVNDLAVLPPAPGYRVWVDEPGQFTTQHVTALHHTFHQHPLMQLPQLAQLAGRLMASGQCRFMAPGATQASALASVLHEASPDGRGIDEVFSHIERPGTWVALYNVETDPAYRAFLDEVMASVRSLLTGRQPGIFKVSGYVFISAPPSVTPFHIDRENNFWLQLCGRKTINVWDATDREVVAAKDVEDFVIFGSLDGVRLKDSVRSRSHEFQCGPGDGVYFPSTSPHMTQVLPGDGVCVSMGVVFYTQVTRRHARVHQVNHVLRRLGLSPRSPGESLRLDRLKAPFGYLLALARKGRRGRGFVPPPGSY
ncbi:MAG TPA: cupin domain-containing protein, partial [Albitalea sp.]|nr:cupin domain-containing protein [Albitalea sp.]